MSLLLDTLSKFVTAFLPRSKHRLISYLKLASTVILEPKKKNLSLFPHSSSVCHDGARCHDLSFLNVEF